MSVTIKDKITVVAPEEAALALSGAYQAIVGQKPSPKILAMMLAQWALETGNGERVHNYNFGNKKATSTDEFVQFFRCSEVVNGQTVFYDPPHPACRFSAYRTVGDGARAYIRSLKDKAHWWKGLQTGTTSGFVQGLTTPPAYFTANPNAYLGILENRKDRYMSLAKRYGGMSTGTQVVLGTAISAGILFGFQRVLKSLK